MSKITEETLQEAGDLITRGLLTHINKLNVGYNNAGEKDFRVSLGLIINEGVDATHKLKVDMSFDLEKIKDTFSTTVNENQGNLFDKKKEEKIIPCPIRPDLDGVFESICAKCKKRDGIFISYGEGLPYWYDGDEPVKVPEGALVSHMPCPSWADEDYKLWCDWMVDQEITPKEEPVKPKPQGRGETKAGKKK